MKKILLVLLSLILIFSFAACGGGESEEPADEEAVAEEPAAEEPVENDDGTLGIGVEGELADVKATLIAVEESTGTDYFTPDEGKVYLLPEFTIVNGTAEELSISSMMSFKVIVDGNELSIDVSALASSDKLQLDTQLAAGEEVTGVIGVQAPADWKVIEIEFEPIVLSDEKLIFKSKK